MTAQGGTMSEATIEALLAEGRTFPPPREFKKTARIVDAEIYDEAERDFEGFWARQAADLVDWIDEWNTILEWGLPFAKWFVGGTLNVSANCLDRHVAAGHGDQVAYYGEGEPGDARTITYAQLLDDVQRVANVLKSLGIQKGDRVNIYLGMVPELPIAMLACARIGAPHSVVFGGFSSDAMRDRINAAEARLLITADGAWRRARSCRSSRAPTPPWRRRRRSSGVSWCGAPVRTSPCRTAATSGGTTSSPASPPSARPSQWTPRTFSISSTRAARPPSPRGSCTPPAATSRRSRGRT